MHRHDASTEVLTAGDRAATRVDRVRLDPPPLDGPRTPAELRAMAGHDDHGRAGSAGSRRCGSSATCSRRRASRSTTRGSCRSCPPRRPRRRSCSTSSSGRRASTPARGWRAPARCSPRTRRCGGSPTSPACRPRPAVCSSAAARPATSARSSPARWKWRHDAGGAHDRTRGLLVASTGAHSSVAQAARVMDADVVAVAADERGRMHGDALRAAVDSLRRRRSRAAVRDRRHVPAPPTPASSTTSRARPPCAPTWACGCTSTAPTAAPGSPRRACAIGTPASSTPTASSSIRTSGCSPRSTRARLIYRDPSVARAAHTQHAEYLDVLQDDATF